MKRLTQSDWVSVIVPVFNGEKYIAKCLDSIMAQTYDRVETIVVNDGSTDGSAAVLSSYCERNNIKVITQANGGLSAARNAGLETAGGDWVVFVDSDDAIHPELIERVLRAAQEQDVDFARYNERNVSISDVGNFENVVGEVVIEVFEDSVSYYIEKNLKASACVSMYKRSSIGGIRFIPGLIYEDLDFTWRYLRQAKRGLYMEWTPYNYAQREGSITRSMFDERKLSSIDFIIRNIAKAYENSGDDRLERIRHSLFVDTVKKQVLKPFKHLDDNERARLSDSVCTVVAGLIRDGMVGMLDFSPRWWMTLIKMQIKAKQAGGA